MPRRIMTEAGVRATVPGWRSVAKLGRSSAAVTRKEEAMRTTHQRIDALPLPRLTAAIVLALAATLLLAPASRAETVVKAIMYSDLRIIDPIWSTVRITRNHGYMIYD